MAKFMIHVTCDDDRRDEVFNAIVKGVERIEEDVLEDDFPIAYLSITEIS